MRVEESIEINKPLKEVFDYVSDVGNYPQWMAHVLEVLKDTEGPHGPVYEDVHSAGRADQRTGLGSLPQSLWALTWG